MVLQDIITIGSNTLDVFVKTNVDLVRHTCGKKAGISSKGLFMAYPVGQKILIDHLDFQVGGGGTNTAVAFSRLGLKTAYLGKIGNDENGVKVFRLLKNEKVEFIGPLGDSTGFSVVLDSIQDDRTILVHKGCNDDLKFSEIHPEILATKWFYFSSMVGDSLKTLKKLAIYASKNKINLAFNPSYYLAKIGEKELNEILNACNVLILNKEEAAVLSGKKNMDDMLKELKSKIPGVVVITDGKRGVFYYDGKVKLFAEPKKNLKIVETTGAGDAFASGFVAGLINNKDPKTALKMGFIEAEGVIEAYGAKNNLVSKRKMIELLKKDRRKITSKKL